MVEFIKSVAPVFVAGAEGVVLILILKRKSKSDDKAETFMAEGITLGLCFGAGIGSSIPVHLSYFISFGTPIGSLVGMQIKK